MGRDSHGTRATHTRGNGVKHLLAGWMRDGYGTVGGEKKAAAAGSRKHNLATRNGARGEVREEGISPTEGPGWVGRPPKLGALAPKAGHLGEHVSECRALVMRRVMSRCGSGQQARTPRPSRVYDAPRHHPNVGALRAQEGNGASGITPDSHHPNELRSLASTIFAE